MNSNIYIIYFLLFCNLPSKSLSKILDNDKMYIIIEEKIFPINLIENAITKEIISILPLKTKIIEEKSSINKYMQFKAHMETIDLIEVKDIPIKANKGDLMLIKGKELILFNEASNIINDNGDYIKIGNTDNCDDLMNSLKRNKTIFLWNSLNYENHEGKVKPYGYYANLYNYITWKIFTFVCFLII